MQKLMGQVRRGIAEYQMLQDGDVVAVGLSGGKDSVALLVALCRLRAFIGIDYTVKAITIDPGFNGIFGDYSVMEGLCQELGVEYLIKRTEIGQVVFETKEESNPCSLCARMRRGALHDACLDLGCNKLALGHHMDDAVETFIMNLLNEGRIGCFSPVTYLSRKNITMIRPLVLAEERDVRAAVKREGLPVVKSVCPVDGHTEREWTKNFLKEMEQDRRGVKNRLFGAMRRAHVSEW